ncbi:MAG: helix-turn-helix domain-containing protein [Spirochaetes bacterium]|nr:helix-turn-helix domain-containing protein [Spirochaetota bacterium]
MLKNSGKTYGERIRALREMQKLTLKGVASSVGISESLLSQIERNKVSPSIDTLIRIADTLGVDMEHLFKDYRQQRTVSILRKENRSRLEKDGVVYEQLSRLIDGETETAVEVVLLELSPGCRKGSTQYGHRGKEVGILLEGEVELLYGGISYNLHEGDSISFDSTIPHTLINHTDKRVRAIWVMSPPKLNFFSDW